MRCCRSAWCMSSGAVREAFLEAPEGGGGAHEPVAQGPRHGGGRRGFLRSCWNLSGRKSGGRGGSGQSQGRHPGVSSTQRAGDAQRDVSKHQRHRERDAQFTRGDWQGVSLGPEDRPVEPVDGVALLPAEEGFRRVKGHKELGAPTQRGRTNRACRGGAGFPYRMSISKPAEILTI